jgi:hypothetical protein
VLDVRGSIPSSVKKFFLTPHRPDRLWGPPSLLYNGTGGCFLRGLKLTSHIYLVQRLKMGLCMKYQMI